MKKAKIFTKIFFHKFRVKSALDLRYADKPNRKHAKYAKFDKVPKNVLVPNKVKAVYK